MVGFVSRRYMRGENGSLVVCLSQYLDLRSLYSVYTQSRLSSVVFRIPALMKSIDMFILHDTIIDYRALFNGAVVSGGPSCTIQYGKQNVEILELYVEIKKSKNELFKMSYILIYLATF